MCACVLAYFRWEFGLLLSLGHPFGGLRRGHDAGSPRVLTDDTDREEIRRSHAPRATRILAPRKLTALLD